MAKGTHQYVDDPRNQSILININGELFPCSQAKISVFDSGFILGDGVWDGVWEGIGITTSRRRPALLNPKMLSLFEQIST